MWAIIELNLWVVVASIPSLRPLVTRTLRDIRQSRSQHRAKRYTDGSGSGKSFKGGIWPNKGPSSTPSDDRLALDSDRAVSDPSHSMHNYNIKVSARGPRERGWTPLGVAGNGEELVQLQDIGTIQVDREIRVS